MIAAVVSLTLLGLGMGWLLGLAARYLRVESDPLQEEIQQLLPGVNCGQCGFPGCGGAAEALAAGQAAVTLCPPGGPPLARALAAKLGVTLEGGNGGPPLLASVDEATCIGCAHCGKRCPTDAIVGAPKQIHGVIQDACIGCGLCVEICPTECLQLRPVAATLKTWHWPKPALSFGV
ncbi:MAG: RnfABCDGE type electron transport complex subunit B [Candidatus Competibacteraceae bacterium]|nr:RnfABCDGE type electron transport complex subunit B [Candidatus Competibacteraceae bacterium]